MIIRSFLSAICCMSRGSLFDPSRLYTLSVSLSLRDYTMLRLTSSVITYNGPSGDGRGSIVKEREPGQGSRDGCQLLFRDVSGKILTFTDNGKLMESIRNSCLQKEENVSSEAKAALLLLTNYFQRAVWLLHRWTLYGAEKLTVAKV